MQKKVAHLIDRNQTIYADEVYVYDAAEVDTLLRAISVRARNAKTGDSAIARKQWLEELIRLLDEQSH